MSSGIELLSAFGNVDATFDLTPEQLLERVKVLGHPRLGQHLDPDDGPNRVQFRRGVSPSVQAASLIHWFLQPASVMILGTRYRIDMS